MRRGIVIEYQNLPVPLQKYCRVEKELSRVFDNFRFVIEFVGS